MIDIRKFWKTVLRQDAIEMKQYFAEDAYINWHCTNEHFSVDEYIRANCEYPGEWDGKIERVEELDNLMITVTNVFTVDKALSFHVVSFFKVQDDKILSLDEYYGDDGIAPQWRLDKKIGKEICK